MLAKALNLKLDLVLVNNMDSVFQDINKGKADMIGKRRDNAVKPFGYRIPPQKRL